MPHSFTIKINTLTPLWTGGVNGTSNQLHISGLIGSMRYWYEAIVRGTGGYACDPSSQACIYDPELGKQSVCAACYLFGTTGWARLFRMNTTSIQTVPLHFRSSLNFNRTWLEMIFEGRESEREQNNPQRKLQVQTVLFGSVDLQFVARGIDSTYAQQQCLLLLTLLEQYAGIGAKQQFGFGQFCTEQLDETALPNGITSLYEYLPHFLHADGPDKERVHGGKYKSGLEVPAANMKDFFSLTFTLKRNTAQRFISATAIPSFAQGDSEYIPIAFDIRYKSVDPALRTGFDLKGWNSAQLNALMGAAAKKGETIPEDKRSASRIFVSMPFKRDNQYRCHIYGFALPDIETTSGFLTPETVLAQCKEILQDMIDGPFEEKMGSELVKKVAR